VKANMPQRVWWISTISRVLRRWWEMIKERTTSCQKCQKVDQNGGGESLAKHGQPHLVDDTTGVADDVGVASLQAQQILHVNARVHAGNDGHVRGRSDGLLARVDRGMHGLAGRVLLVVGQEGLRVAGHG